MEYNIRMTLTKSLGSRALNRRMLFVTFSHVSQVIFVIDSPIASFSCSITFGSLTYTLLLRKPHKRKKCSAVKSVRLDDRTIPDDKKANVTCAKSPSSKLF